MGQWRRAKALPSSGSSSPQITGDVCNCGQNVGSAVIDRLLRDVVTYATPTRAFAAGIKPVKLSGRMGHANVRTTLDVYVHLFPDDDASEDMTALGALATPIVNAGNVISLHG